MGMFAYPSKEFHRFVLEIKGGKGLTPKQFEAYRAAIAKVVEKYGAKIAQREYVVVKKTPKKKGGK